MKKLTFSTAVILGTLALIYCLKANVNKKHSATIALHKPMNNYDFKKFNGFNLSETLGQADGDSKLE